MSEILQKILLVILSVSFLGASGQHGPLDDYIKEGLKGNLVLKQRNLTFENAMISLRAARSLFIPSLDFQTTYTTASGGRNIKVPVGEMLNPVYTTLNQLTGQNIFPHIEDQEINFLPKNYYDSRVRLTMPIYNSDIGNNRKIKEHELRISGKDIEIYERELILEIKTTYYHYISALKAVSIHQNAIDLAEEGKRKNERLIEAGRGLPAYVMRSETEIVQARAKLEETRLQAETLKRYFNALLNREEDTEIIADDQDFTKVTLPDTSVLGIQKREELEVLNQAIQLRDAVVHLNRQALMPKLSGFADMGSQAERMRFSSNSLYYMVGVQLSIPIFSGGRNIMKIRQSENEAVNARWQRDYADRQLEVAVTKAYNEVLAAVSNHQAALKQLEMAETYYRLINKGFDAGVNSYIETVDARTQLSTANLAASVNYYKLLTALAVLERQTASYPLSESEKN